MPTTLAAPACEANMDRTEVPQPTSNTYLPLTKSLFFNKASLYEVVLTTS